VSVFVSEPVHNPAAAGEPEFTRADLVFYGVDHSGPSFEARIFLNSPGADLSTPRDPEAGYAGSFTIFGHAGCAGDVGHCDVPTGAADPFDVRPPHALTPQTKTVIITDALRLVTDPELTITIVPVKPGALSAELVDTLQFDEFRLLTYL
jgi:tyrosinase